MNRTLNSFTQRTFPSWLVLPLLLLAPCLQAQTGLVFFIDDAPANSTVDCFGDVPDAPSLRAGRMVEGGLIDTFLVTAFDSLSAPSAPCTGGTLFQIWQTSGELNTAREIREVTFGPPPAEDAPSFDLSILPALRDTVDCNQVNNPGHPDSYDRWLGDRRVATSAAIRMGCGPVVAIDDNAPDTLINFSCNDSLSVTFMATDLCGGATSVTFVYFTVDTTGPVLSGVVPDTIVLTCTAAVPSLPEVTLTDCDTAAMLTFVESSSQLLDGSCATYEYDLERTWTAVDRCGNSTIVRRRYEVRDAEPPNFTRPQNTLLTCLQDPSDLDLTGRPSELTDNCSPTDELEVTFSDDIIGAGVCQNSFNIQRTWTVTDRCGNSRVRVQQIRVRDNVPPIFTAPEATVTANCEDYLNTDITGTPTNLVDQCDESVNLSFEDVITPGACTNNFTVEREWRIFDDCGNSRAFTQIITVQDTTKPVLITAPTDLVTSCNSNRQQEFLFNTWVQDLGGAVFGDGCTPADALTIEVFVSGTTDQPLLPAINCTEADGTVRRLAVDIIATDDCGNSTTTTMEYRQVDEQPINIFDCPESMVISTNENECVASVSLPPPTIQDQCSSSDLLQLNLRDTVTITSQAMNQAELGSVPVDPITFDLPILTDLPVNGFTTGIFTITLENIDAEGEDEFFFIYAEDGTLLGTTERGTVQCETVITVDSISPFQFTRYARDGVVSIRLEPNIPEGRPGTFAINNLCEGGATASIHLRQAIFRLTEIVYEIDIDGNGFNRVDPVGPLTMDLDVGLHQITYRATDCGGAVDECSYSITVEDQVPPIITCPDPIEVIVTEDACAAELSVPLPLSVFDNCSAYTLASERFPLNEGYALFPFNYDPNLNSFQAGPVTLTLQSIPVNVLDSVDLDFYFRGMFSNRSAILDILLPDGTVLATTQRGDATCTQEGNLRIRIAAQDFLAQVNESGQLDLTVRPLLVTVPPGQEGDGITPCDEENITEEGGDDGFSGIFVQATYRTLFLQYFAEGATTVSPRSTDFLQPVPVVNFSQGLTNFSYVTSDPGGNTDTCSFAVNIIDTTAPVAVCTPTAIFVDPSGLEPITLDPAVIGGSSTDNCTIDSMRITPNVFSCEQYGNATSISLLVIDNSGNRDSCTTIISIVPEVPEPTASTSLCGGDTLRLFANPPTVALPGQTIYTYQWFDPSGTFISNQENPIIPGVDESREGAYRVVIRGLTGCEAEGVVNIDIGNIPAAPEITAPQRVCIGAPAALSSVSSYAGDVRYEWFRGVPGTGTFLGESQEATFLAPFATGEPDGSFYAIVYVNGCASAPSAIVSVGTTERPTVAITEEDLTICQFSDLSFTAGGTGNLAYEWVGPNDFTAASATINLTNVQPEDAGTYYVRAVRSEGCFSLPDSVVLEVIPASEPTTLLSISALCPTDTLVLTATETDGDRYLFSGPNGLEFDLDEPFLRITPVVPAITGEWTVRIQRGTCPSAPSPAVFVQLGEAPQPLASTLPDPVCAGNDLRLQGSSSISGSTFQWRGPNDFMAEGIAPILENVDASFSGAYILTATAPSGCFAEDTLSVSVLPGIEIESIDISSGSCLSGGEPVSLTATISPALAPTNSPYTYRWNGPEGTSTSDTFNIPNVSLASNGTYTLEVSNILGCVSPTFTMEVEFDFAPAAPVQPFSVSGLTSICAGDSLTLMTNDFGPGSAYLWRLPDGTNIPTSTNTLRLQDIEPSLSGGFTVRVIRGGCTSLPSEVRMITVTPFPDIFVTANDPACTGQPITFQATDLPGATYSWRGPSNFSSSLPNPTIVRADPSVHPGSYSVVADINGCSSDTITIDVTVAPTPGVPVIQPIAPVCISDPAAVLELSVNPNTATEGASYQWFIQDGQVAVAPPTTELTLEVTDFGLFAGGGLFDFTVRATNGGCTSEAATAVTIRLDEADASFQPNAGRDSTVCEGFFLLEAAPGGVGSGRWSLVAGMGEVVIVNPTSRTTAVQGLTQVGGPYQFAWTLSNGSCTNYAADTITLTVTDGEEAFAGEDILACVREEVRLNASPTMMAGSGGLWTQALAQELLQVVIEEPNNPNTVITGLQANNIYSFTWAVFSSCGTKTDNVLVTVSDPSPFAGADQTVCTDDRRATLNADEATIGSTGRWRSLALDITVVTPDSPSSTVIGLLPGENLFVWEVDEGFCGPRSRDTVVITYVEPPQPRDDDYEAPFQGGLTFDPTENDNLPPETTVAFGELPLGSNLIDNGDGTFTFQAPANFVGELAIDYEVLSDGCTTASATVFIQVGKDVDCEAPNIFTPNNDAMNDLFIVPCLLDTDRFPNSQVTIYNQWGDEVFRSGRPYLSDWDGTFQGNQLPVATYFYTIDFGDGRDGDSGSVRIER